VTSAQVLKVLNADLAGLFVGVLQCRRDMDYLGRLGIYTFLPPALTIIAGLYLTLRARLPSACSRWRWRSWACGGFFWSILPPRWRRQPSKAQTCLRVNRLCHGIIPLLNASRPLTAAAPPPSALEGGLAADGEEKVDTESGAEGSGTHAPTPTPAPATPSWMLWWEICILVVDLMYLVSRRFCLSQLRVLTLGGSPPCRACQACCSARWNLVTTSLTTERATSRYGLVRYLQRHMT
jgi:hypothetical protein